MKMSHRVVISFLAVAMILFIGMLFWPFILNNIIEPVALVVWLLLRILILSIDQIYFWYAVILLAVIFLMRLLPKEQSTIQSSQSRATNATIINIGHWRVLFTYNNQNIRDEKILKRELTHLLTSLYASKQSTSDNYGIYAALQRGEIPLPEHIRTFLFSADPQESGGPIKRFFQSIRKWIRRLAGQEKAERHRMIDEVLDFVETSLEIKNDDRKFIHNEH